MERFVVGTGRCGSTLASRMLACSPEVASVCEVLNGLPGDRRFSPEPLTGAEVWDLVCTPQPFVTMITSRGYPVAEITYPFEHPRSRYSAADDVPWIAVATLPWLSEDPDSLLDATAAFLTARPPAPAADHYRALFAWLAERAGARVWIERSGASIAYLEDLASAFPGGRFLHLHRAGEEAALSMREHHAFRLAISIVNGLHPDLDLAEALADPRPHPDRPDVLAPVLEARPAAEHFGRFWADQLADGFRAVARLRPEQYLEVAFEDLVARPLDVLRAVATFFELDPARDRWMDSAAGLVRGNPPARLAGLAPTEREALVAACRTGNRLLGRRA